MSTPTHSRADRADAGRSSEPNRWAVLAVLGIAQLMVVLDATVVNIALPSAQLALHFSSESRQWVVTAYALAFGSLLLLGGKLGDLFGRKWTFVTGMFGFAIVSALGGLAQNFAMLVSARALQGCFGALLAPSALSLLTVTFADSPDRPKAFGIFGAIAGGGASVGLLLGGALTQALSWRWCLYVNLVIAIPTALVSMRLLVNRGNPARPKIDLPGTLLGSLGLFCIVFGFSEAETKSWSDPVTIVSFALAVVLLVTFVVVERRHSDPLLPLHIVADRARGGAYSSIGLASCGVFGVFLFLTYFMQENLRLSPLTTGIGFLPMTALIVVTSTTVQTQALPRLGAKPLIVTGMVLALGAMVIFAQLTPGSAYVSGILPGLLVCGLGLGLIFAPAFGTATLRVAPQEAGVASAMVNTMQQIGGSVGTALLSTIFASAAGIAAAGSSTTGSGRGAGAAVAIVHGYTTAFWWAAGIFGVGLVIALLLLPAVRPGAGSSAEGGEAPAVAGA